MTTEFDEGDYRVLHEALYHYVNALSDRAMADEALATIAKVQDMHRRHRAGQGST